MKKNDAAEFKRQIVDVFEDYLARKHYSPVNEDDQGDDPAVQAGLKHEELDEENCGF